MSEGRKRAFSIEAIIIVDDHADSSIQTADGIEAELKSHFEYLNSVIDRIAVQVSDSPSKEER